MSENVAVNLISFQVTSLQAAFLTWCKSHPYGKITVQLQDGIPVWVEKQDADGWGDKIMMSRVAQISGIGLTKP